MHSTEPIWTLPPGDKGNIFDHVQSTNGATRGHQIPVSHPIQRALLPLGKDQLDRVLECAIKGLWSTAVGRPLCGMGLVESMTPFLSTSQRKMLWCTLLSWARTEGSRGSHQGPPGMSSLVEAKPNILNCSALRPTRSLLSLIRFRSSSIFHGSGSCLCSLVKASRA